MKSTHDTSFLRCVIDAIPSFVLVVDDDMRIHHYNAAATRLLGTDDAVVIRHRGGDALHCIHSTDDPGGCGRGEFCKTCVIRSVVGQAVTGKGTTRLTTRMELVASATVKKIHLQISASPFPRGIDALVLLVLEDISQIIELGKLLPICMYCKKIRDDRQYWEHAESYFSRHWDVRFSHGLCPACANEQMQSLGLEIPAPTSSDRGQRDGPAPEDAGIKGVDAAHKSGGARLEPW